MCSRKYHAILFILIEQHRSREKPLHAVQEYSYRTYVEKDTDLTRQHLNKVAQQLDQKIQGVETTDARQRKKRIDPPIVQTVRTDENTLWLHLTDGRVLGAPLAWFPSLVGATTEQRQHWDIIGAGTGVH